MLTLKIMAESDMPDDDRAKDYTLTQIADNEDLQFLGTGESGQYGVYKARVVAIITERSAGKECGQRVVPLTGNAYVMNANGKTIATRHAHL
jgi:hypothetical protein